MILAIDIGNSNIVLGAYEGEQISAHWRLTTHPFRTGDEICVLFRSLFSDSPLNPRTVDRVVIGCVVPPLMSPIHEAIHELFPRAGVTIVGADTVPWLNIRIDNRNTIGADLIANAVSSRDYVSDSACAVFDFGTALSTTVVDADGSIRGVSIAPGLLKAALALSEGTAQLPLIELAAPPGPFGTNTVHAIQAGIVYGYASMVEGMVRRFSDHLGTRVKAVATGGLAGIIAPLVDTFEAVDQWLTLNGLRKIAERVE